MLLPFDLLLSLLLITTGWAAVFSRDLFRAVILFIIFGLLLSIAWIRLEAPDIALAEAAIGAGLTGALLLNTIAFLRSREVAKAASVLHQTHHVALRRITDQVLLVISISTGIIMAFLLLSVVKSKPDDLKILVESHLHESGVTYPVTAVLLNFRGYDTFLEIGVLVLAVIGLLSLKRTNSEVIAGLEHRDSILSGFTRFIIPFIIIIAGYLLWSGTKAPGGAFQAGAVLGAGVVLLSLSGSPVRIKLSRAIGRLLLVFGFFVFLAYAFGALLGGLRLLEYPAGQAGIFIIIIEIALTLSIASILAGLFVLSSPGDFIGSGSSYENGEGS